jgi:hypothetical protein
MRYRFPKAAKNRLGKKNRLGDLGDRSGESGFREECSSGKINDRRMP